MEYSVNQLSKMAGVSPRTLRYYDEIGLLRPLRVAASGYRLYGRNEVDTLQQILFYRSLDFPLAAIKEILSDPHFDRERAFAEHLSSLLAKRERLDALIDNVQKSLAALKGEETMTDREKFEGFTAQLVAENEQKYGREIREKYGNQIVEESNAKLKNMSQAQYDESIRLNHEFEAVLKEAIATGDVGGELAQRACDLHKQWLCIFYPRYNREYHRSLAEMYVQDERFQAHYDKLAPGCAKFLRDAIHIYVGS